MTLATKSKLAELDQVQTAFPIEILMQTTDKIVAILRVGSSVNQLAIESLVFMIAHEVNARGLLSMMGAEGRPHTVDSHVSFYSRQTGPILRAEARPIRVDGSVATWRARVYFAENSESIDEANCAAEVTETQILINSNELASDTAPAPPLGLLAAPPIESTETPGSAPRRSGSVARQRLDQIFKGAFRVISKKGYGNATIREIASAAGMPIPTMYLYVKTKEDLLYLMTKEYLSKLISDFEDSLSKSASSTAVLKMAVVQYITYCNTHRRLITLTYREGKWLTRENRTKIFKLDLSFVDIWKRIVERGIETGEFQVRNPELAANHIYFLCTAWALRHWNLSRFGEAAVRESMLEFVMRAVKGSNRT